MKMAAFNENKNSEVIHARDHENENKERYKQSPLSS